MWTLTSDDVQRIKEELKGRRAALQARYAEELRLVEADLADIETMERVADAFAVRHLVDEEPAADPPQAASLVDRIAEFATSPVEPVMPDPLPVSDPKGGVSRWRMRLNREAEVEPS